MSKLAKKPISIPQGVTVTMDAGFAVAKGAKGELSVRIPDGIVCEIKESGVMVTTHRNDQQSKANIGTTWALLRNAFQGISAGFSKVLEIEGVGYKMNVEGTNVVLSLGFVNPVKVAIPKGITATVEKNTMTISGVDKELVGRFAAEIRALKKPEPYKGKGIRYQGEVIRRKVGKKAATAA